MTDSTTLVLGATSLALVVLLYVWFAVALAALFRKIGEPVWKAWIPVLNVAMVLKIGGFSPWLVLLNIVPLFGGIAFIVVFIVSVHRISVGFGAGGGMTVVGALFPVIWASILGFGSARWDGDGGGGSARSGIDEDSVPVRRGREFDGPYVPLIGGWTPEQATDGERGAGAARPVEPAVMSEPVALPFAAPSGSLADAVPSPSDWAAPSDLLSSNADGSRRRGAGVPADDALAPAQVSAGWTPPAPTSVFDVLDALRAEAPATGETPIDARSHAVSPARVDDDAEAVGPHVPVSSTAGAPSPVWAPPAPTGDAVVDASSAPSPADDAGSAPWANPPRRSARSAADTPDVDAGAPLTRPAPAPVPAPRAPEAADPDEFPELSEAVSAVPDAPDAGAPRSARTSVSALYAQPGLPADRDDDSDDLDALDRTVVTRRKRIPWALIPPGGAPIDLTAPIVILGRRPASDPAYPDAQLVSISDETRTVSKTHARLQLRGETWYVTDLDSTNGVLFATLMGTEVEAPPGEEIEAGERFFLGDAEVRLSRRDV